MLLPVLLHLALWLVPSGVTATDPNPAVRCRCAPLPLERYFEQAEIVVVARVRSVRRTGSSREGTERLEVAVAPRFRPGGPFKGSLDSLILATSTSSAACGVPVRVGQDYVLFASRVDVDGRSFAWFDSCSGSRVYPEAPSDELFIGLASRDVLPRLAALAEISRAPSLGARYHTSPACWSGPRVYHESTPSVPSTVTISLVPGPFPEVEGVVSPNRAYRAWTPSPPERATAGDAAVVLVDHERSTLLRIEAATAQTSPSLTWISEKLLFFRVVRSRVLFTDVLVDVERGQLLYTEDARYGDGVYTQFQQACGGRCLCVGVPDRVDRSLNPQQVSSARRVHADTVRGMR